MPLHCDRARLRPIREDGEHLKNERTGVLADIRRGGDRRRRIERAPISMLQQTCYGYELLSMCPRNSEIEPNRTVPCGSLASMDPSA